LETENIQHLFYTMTGFKEISFWLLLSFLFWSYYPIYVQNWKLCLWVTETTW